MCVCVCAKSNGAALVLDFAMEDLPLGTTASLVAALVMKDLPLGRTLMMIIYIHIYTYIYTYIYIYIHTYKLLMKDTEQ